MSTFLMPSLGADMEAGTLVEKLVVPGETLRRGDVIAAIETQKGVIEIEVFEDGVLGEWVVGLGETVPVGTPLAEITSASESEAETAVGASAEAEQNALAKSLVTQNSGQEGEAEEVSQSVPPPVIAPARAAGSAQELPTRVRATPAARRLAARWGLDLHSLASSPEETLYRADVEAWQSRPQPKGMPGMRAAIAAAMARSKREIPHFYLSHITDLTAAEAFVAQWNSDKSPQDRLLIGALYIKALALAVRRFPEFSGTFENGEFEPGETAHIGLAINLRGGGLVAPALFDPGAQSLEALMQSMRSLIFRVKSGRFQAKELTGGTITLSSLGERGVDQLFGVIQPPQVAIIGIGTPRLRPWVHQQAVVPRKVACLTLAADHRVSDGHRGALFLNAIDKHLQNPEKL